MNRRQVELKTVPQMQTMQRAGLLLHRALDAAVAAGIVVTIGSFFFVQPLVDLARDAAASLPL